MTVASPIVAAVAALFLSGCTFTAYLMSASSSGVDAQLLLKAGVLAFVMAEAVALALGILGALRVKFREGARGLPEAFLGIFAVCLFALTVLVFLLSCAASPAP